MGMGGGGGGGGSQPKPLMRFEARGLVPERPYRFHVCAVNGSGRGLWGHIRLLAPYLHVTPLRVLSGFR